VAVALAVTTHGVGLFNESLSEGQYLFFFAAQAIEKEPFCP
jgi:hypothetical protein